MSPNDALILQGKMLEWSGLEVTDRLKLSCLRDTVRNCVWVSNGSVIAQIPYDCFFLDAPDTGSIDKYITLPNRVSQVWRDTSLCVNSQLGLCIRFTDTIFRIWVKEIYIKLFNTDKYNYDYYASKELNVLFIVKRNTRCVVGVISGLQLKDVYGTNREKINAMSNRELAEVILGSACSYCIYNGDDCKDRSCYDGVKAWLESECDINDK